MQKKKRKRKKRTRDIEGYKNRELTLYDEIKEIEKEVKRLQSLKEQKDEEINQIHIQETEHGLALYADKELREEIINDIEQTTFSKSKIDKIKNEYAGERTWNQDTVDLETIEILYSMDKFLLEQPNENIITYTIDTIESIGDKVIKKIEEGEKDDDT